MEDHPESCALLIRPGENYIRIRPQQGAAMCWEYIGENVADIVRLLGLPSTKQEPGDPIASARIVFDCDCEDGQGMERRYLAHGEFLEIWSDCEACDATGDLTLEVDFFGRDDDYPGDYGIWADGKPLTNQQIQDLIDGAIDILNGQLS